VIPLARPDITEEDIAAVAAVLRTGQLIQGQRVAEFEQSVSRVVGGGEVVAVSNGTAALHLTLLAAGIRDGDEVAVPTFSWPATANAVVMSGARPVFVDIERRTFGMDAEALAKVVLRSPRLRAVIPVHAFGHMADMNAIVHAVDGRDIMIIEDAACALGASRDGVAAGARGNAGCFSFHPRKAATTGEGGAVRTAEPGLAAELRRLRNHGIESGTRPPDFVTAGLNNRMTEFQAALGVSQLNRYADLVRARRDRAAVYDELLADMPVETPAPVSADAHVYQAYVVMLEREAATRRTSIIEEMRNAGVETSIGTYHIPLLTHYRRTLGHGPGDFPVGEDIAARALALPLSTSLTAGEQEFVCDTLHRVLAGAR
jgi:dTDP-4-amino-4,6-dideoxygalactose transaminase